MTRLGCVSKDTAEHKNVFGCCPARSGLRIDLSCSTDWRLDNLVWLIWSCVVPPQSNKIALESRDTQCVALKSQASTPRSRLCCMMGRCATRFGLRGVRACSLCSVVGPTPRSVPCLSQNQQPSYESQLLYLAERDSGHSWAYQPTNQPTNHFRVF